MARIELTTRVAAPRDRCFDLARSVELHVRSTAATGERAVAGRTTGLLELGDEVTWRGRTLMRDVFDYTAPLGPLGRVAERLVLTRYLTRLLEARNREITLAAESEAWRQFVPAPAEMGRAVEPEDRPDEAPRAAGHRGWGPFEGGATLGRRGSEDGAILRDEDHELGARITLERDGRAAPFAIACGIYGRMVHTWFFTSETEALREFPRLQTRLAAILGMIPRVDDPDGAARARHVTDAIHRFIEEFP